MRIGIVTEVDPASARARVTFDDLTSDDVRGLLSDWLHVVQHGSTEDSGYWLPRVGAQVLCAIQDNADEVGYILGTIYNSEDTPARSGMGVWYQRFQDGTVIEYDPAAGVTIDTPLAVTIRGGSISLNG